jgi:hypothetical protein
MKGRSWLFQKPHTGRRHDSWARCREPYKATIDALASRWIEGALSNTELALELWKLHLQQLDKTRLENDLKPGFTIQDLMDIEADLVCLAEAMCLESANPNARNPEIRRNWLAACCLGRQGGRRYLRCDKAFDNARCF